jgi:hypothetical protein
MSSNAAALEHEIATLAAQLTGATARLLRCVRAYDATGEWAVQGGRSCAHWLAWRIGLNLRAAREHVRVAHALAGLPRIEAALEAGEISYSKARAITRIARPETEADLLAMAREGTAAQIERLVRACRTVDGQGNERAVAQQQGRWVQTHWDRDGMLVIDGRLPPEAGAVVLKALEAAERELHDGSAEHSATPLQRRADGARPRRRARAPRRRQRD